MHIFIAVFFFIFVLAGCSGGVGKIEIASGTFDVDGVAVMEESTESIEIAKANALALSSVKPEPNPCASEFTPEQVIELKEGGQEMHLMRGLLCDVVNAMADVVKATNKMPTSTQGEVAYEGSKTIVSVENSDAAEASSKNRVMGTAAIAGATAYGFGAFAGAMAGAGASETTVGDIQMSNSGDSMGGAGGEGPGGSVDGGERNMALAINGDTHIQSGTSNTQASGREKPVAVDNPIVSGGPENTIVNDTDGKNDASLF